MTQTPNLGLNKPDQSDFYNVDHFNENADKIDAEAKSVRSQLSGIAGSLSNLNIPNSSGIAQITWYDLPLVNGFTGNVNYSKINGIVYIFGAVSNVSGLALTSNIDIGTLHAGFRHKRHSQNLVVREGIAGPSFRFRAWAWNTGVITVQNYGAIDPGANFNFIFTGSYPAEI